MREPRKVSKADIRRLNADLGVGIDRVFIGGLLVALSIIAGLALVLSPFTLDVAPAEPAAGRVDEILYTQGKNSRPKAVVWVGTERAYVSVPNALSCRVGDQIQLVRHKAPLGVRYTAGPRVCSRG
jgi:hypothetical protein